MLSLCLIYCSYWALFFCLLQWFLARKGKVKTTALIAILFSVIAVLMILFAVDFVKFYQTVIAIILWGLFGFLGIVALIIIYILKPKYQDKTVSSTFVWKLSLKYNRE